MYHFDKKAYDEQAQAVLHLLPQIEKAADDVIALGFDNILLLGVGGTYLEWESVRACIGRKTDYPLYVENAAEFLIKKNLDYLTEKTLVIAPSVSGDTKEILQAVSFCKEKGTKVLGFTKNTETPLGKMLDYFLALDTHFCENFYIEYYTLLLCIMTKLGKAEGYDLWKEQLPNVYKELLRHYESFDPTAKEIVHKYHKAPYSIWVGSGPAMWYCVEMMTMCLLEEMQWIRVRPVTSPHFFHGTIEMVEDGVPVFLTKGIDEYRALDQRVEDFLNHYNPTDSTVVFDMAKYPIHGLDSQFDDIAAVLVFAALILDRIPKYYEFYNGHSLAFRRYYRQLDY